MVFLLQMSNGIVFTRRSIFRFFAPHWRHVAPIGAVHTSLLNFTLIGLGLWVYCPQNFKKSNFTNIISPKGWVPCTILTKFTGFIRILSLHKSAKFGCFISINDKTINNLPRWGRFQPNFSCPLAAKLLTGSKKVCVVK